MSKINEKARTKQKVIWAFMEDVTKLRRKKKMKQDGRLESDAETLNRVLREIEQDIHGEMDNELIRMDVRLR